MIQGNPIIHTMAEVKADSSVVLVN